MTITNPHTAGEAVQHDASEAARRILAAISLGAIAPESYPARLHCQDRLTEFAQAAFDKARAEASAIAAAARADLDDLRRSELRADPSPAVLRPGGALDSGPARSARPGSRQRRRRRPHH